jgi:selenocysteine-specific elongation factor
LSSTDLSTAVAAALGRPKPLQLKDLATLLGRTTRDVAETLAEDVKDKKVVALDADYIGAEAWTAFAASVSRVLNEHHRSYPLRRGMPREELRSKLGWERAHWGSALSLLAEQKMVALDQSTVRRVDHVGGTAGRRAEADRIVQLLRKEPLAPPPIGEVLSAAGADMSVVFALLDEGEVVRVGDELYFATPDIERIVDTIIGLIRSRGSLTVAEARDALGTSRKYALALLEHLDGQRITHRIGDSRVLGSKASLCV